MSLGHRVRCWRRLFDRHHSEVCVMMCRHKSHCNLFGLSGRCRLPCHIVVPSYRLHHRLHNALCCSVYRHSRHNMPSVCSVDNGECTFHLSRFRLFYTGDRSFHSVKGGHLCRHILLCTLFVGRDRHIAPIGRLDRFYSRCHMSRSAKGFDGC